MGTCEAAEWGQMRGREFGSAWHLQSRRSGSANRVFGVCRSPSQSRLAGAPEKKNHAGGHERGNWPASAANAIGIDQPNAAPRDHLARKWGEAVEERIASGHAGSGKGHQHGQTIGPSEPKPARCPTRGAKNRVERPGRGLISLPAAIRCASGCSFDSWDRDHGRHSPLITIAALPRASRPHPG